MIDIASSVEISAITAPSPWRGWGRRARWIALWVCSLVAVGYLDKPLAFFIYSSGIYVTVKHALFFRAIKALGTVHWILLLVPLVWWIRRPSAAPTLLLGTAPAIAGLFITIAQWSVGRSRPISNGVYNLHPFQPHFFHDGLIGLFAPQHNQSFPSGHASLAFAIAAALGVVLPRYTVWFFMLASLVGVERLLEDAHYFSDVLAGAGLGIIAALVAGQLCDHMVGKRNAKLVVSSSEAQMLSRHAL